MLRDLSSTERKYLSSLKSIDEYSAKNELTKEVLKGIALGGAIATVFVLPGMAPGIKFFMDLDAKRKAKLRRSVQSLLKRGYIKEVRKNSYVVTSKGHVRLHKYAINEINITRPTKWDGNFRIITFDIPEEKKYARDALNAKLRELGFVTLQRSIYIYPFDFKSEFEGIGNLFGVKDNIIYIVTKDISNYNELIVEFRKAKVLK